MSDTKEDILALAIISILIVVAAVIFGAVVANEDNCTNSTYECRSHQVELCIKQEVYTKDQCIVMLGGSK